MALIYRDILGPRIADVIDDLARLRITVFRDWPYLYDGDADYERQYLGRYARPGTIVVGAFDGARMVGAATGMPLADHADDFAEALADTGIDMADTFYCAESVLLPAYRGQGAGHRFFDHREAFARRSRFRVAAFCAVDRAPDHPALPAGYRPLDAFWRGRGYAPLPGAMARFSWRDIGTDAETVKPLKFWTRTL
jgi:GNAT superfamily N-acetyltransferase